MALHALGMVALEGDRIRWIGAKDLLPFLKGESKGAPHERLITFVTDRPGHDARYAIEQRGDSAIVTREIDGAASERTGYALNMTGISNILCTKGNKPFVRTNFNLSL